MLTIQEQASPHYFAAEDSLASRASARHALRGMRAARLGHRRALPMPLMSTGSLKLVREEDKFVVTTATPGIQLEHLSLELVGKRTLRLQVVQPWTAPGSATKAAEPAPDPPTEAIAQAAPPTEFSAEAAAYAVETTPEPMLDANASVTKPSAEDSATEVAEEDHAKDKSSTVGPDTMAGAVPPYFAADIAQALANEPKQDHTFQMIVVLDKSICLPQLVDGAGITCTYSEGLLRVEIPIATPAPDAEHAAIMSSLLAQKSEAIAELAALEQRLKEQRDKVKAVHAAMRTAKAAAAPALARSIQTLNIIPPPSAVLDSESETAEESTEGTKVGAQV